MTAPIPATAADGGTPVAVAPFVFTAYGVPVPQGSTRAFVVRGRAVTTSASANLRPWRDTVAAAARFEMQGRTPLAGPVCVLAVFTLPRPASRRKVDRWPDRRPDIDKLLRGLLDSLTGPVFTDDAQVVQVACEKRYVGDPEALTEPGVTVEVEAAA
jgi:Holliday junction resolvase RusA-like endonuclease